MNDLNQTELMNEVKLLKLMMEQPRIYIAEYFATLINKLDIEINAYINDAFKKKKTNKVYKARN